MEARANTFTFVAVAMFAIACKTEKSAPQQTTATTTTEVTTASAAPSTASSKPHFGHNSCPSRVHGATATATDTDGGVMISVTASDDATIAEIQSRASTLAATPPEAHRGRFCPEIIQRTTRTITATKTGAEITLVPANAADLPKVRAELRDHLSRPDRRPD